MSFCADSLELLSVPLAALLQRHGQRPVERAGDVVDVVGVHDQRTTQERRGAGEARQHEHPRIVRVLSRHVFLGHQVQSVAQGRDQADAGGAVVAGERAARVRAI